jgi:hypothetical protein
MRKAFIDHRRDERRVGDQAFLEAVDGGQVVDRRPDAVDGGLMPRRDHAHPLLLGERPPVEPTFVDRTDDGVLLSRAAQVVGDVLGELLGHPLVFREVARGRRHELPFHPVHELLAVFGRKPEDQGDRHRWHGAGQRGDEVGAALLDQFAEAFPYQPAQERLVAGRALPGELSLTILR